jgi:hypothetical protein
MQSSGHPFPPQPTSGQHAGCHFLHDPLVESETSIRVFSPSSTLEPRLKAFRRGGPNCWLETTPLVLVGITNRDKRAGSQCLFHAMIDAGF